MVRLATLAGICSELILVVVFLFLILGSTRFGMIDGGVNDHAMNDCVDHYKSTASSTALQVQDLLSLNSFCFIHTANQLQVDEEVIKRDNYIFQRNETLVLLYMVVLITFVGVLLAGLQLLASYKLATLGRGELTGGAEIAYSPQGASFKSSVVGLSILAMSFAFFLVFVLYVYTFRDPNQSSTSTPTLRAASQPAQGSTVQTTSPSP
jgi:hypothetical protein